MKRKEDKPSGVAPVITDNIEIISFAPKASKRRLIGNTVSIWNTSVKSCGITFSAEVAAKYESLWSTEKGPAPGVFLTVGRNNLEGTVYFILGPRGDLRLNPTGRDDGKNLVLTGRRDVLNRLGEILSQDFTDPEKKHHVIYHMIFLKNTAESGDIYKLEKIAT